MLSGWCDGSLDDAELERLDELLRTDPGFRDLYVKYMDQHAVLAATLLPIGDVRLMVQCPGPAGDEPTGGGEAVRAGSGAVSRDRRVGRPSRVPRAWRRWVAVAVALLLAGMIARHWPTGRPGAAIVAGPPLAGDPPRLGLARRIRRRDPARRRRVGAGGMARGHRKGTCWRPVVSSSARVG